MVARNCSLEVSVTLVNEKGETKVLSVEDQWLLDKNLSEGSIWPEQTAFIKYHLSPQKCSPGGADAFLDLN